jgi:hypothetical protein
LGDGEGEQFSVGQARWSADASGPAEVIIDLDLQRGQKEVQVCRHKLIMNTRHPVSGHRPW